MIETMNNDERLAMFLTLLGDRVADLALQQIDPTRGAKLRSLVNEFKLDPPSDEEVDFVLDDFERYFRFAVNTLKEHAPPPPPMPDDVRSVEFNKPLSKRPGQKKVFGKIPMTGNPIQDLNRLAPFQIAQAIKTDQPKTIALILAQLDPEQAARILEALPEEARTTAFLALSQPINVPSPIIDKVLHSTIQRAQQVEEQVQEVDRTDQFVELMRSLPKPTRKEMMEKLTSENPMLAESVHKKLYRFEDIGRLEDRGIQALLSRIESKSLIMALTNAEPKLAARILGNMSKRARQTLEEEISFNQKAPLEEIEEARGEIARVLGRMDEDGEVTL